MKGTLKISIWLTSILFVLLTLLFFFLSPICKWAIEKYDKEFLGREIVMERFWLNLFTGTLEIDGFTLLEADDKSVFIKIASLKTSVNLPKALNGEYEVNKFFLDGPEISILQKESFFNFSDLVNRFSGAEDSSQVADSDTLPTRWSVLNFQISNAHIAYTNKSLGNTIALEKLFVKSPKLAWDKPEMLYKIDFDINSGGSFRNLLKFNTQTQDYDLSLNIKHFNLASWYAYLREVIKVKSFEGELNTVLKIVGNAARTEELGLKGLLNLHGIKIVDPKGYPLFGLGDMTLKVDSIQVKKGLYDLNSLNLASLFCVYEMYTKGSNFDRLFSAATAEAPALTGDTANIPYDNPFLLLTYYTKDVVNNQDLSRYSAKEVSITNSRVVFRDYTLQNKFNFELSKMQLVATNLKSNGKRLSLKMNALLNESGNLKGSLAINPKDFKNLDLNYSITGLRMSDMNPYMLHYIAHPFLDGVVDYTCKTSISASHQIKSDNKLQIRTVYVGKKQKNKTAVDLPVKLAFALLRDYKGNVNLEIPVEGNLDDPKYKLGKVIWGVVKNIFIKAAMAPYQLLASLFGGNEEELKEVKFEFIQVGFADKQQQALDKVVRILNEKQGLKAEFIQVSNNELEQEEWGMFTLKKQYLEKKYGVKLDSFNQALVDSVNGVSVQDTLFTQFVAGKLPNPLDVELPLQEQMKKIIPATQLQEMTLNAMERRNAAIRNFLNVKKKIPAERFRVINTTKQEAANTETVSKYLINYFAE
jgi:hypothetical protein